MIQPSPPTLPLIPTTPGSTLTPPTVVPQPTEDEAQSGNWEETQVLQSIKEASFRGTSPVRLLTGQATQPLGSSVVATGTQAMGRLVTPKQSKRARLRRFLTYLSS